MAPISTLYNQLTEEGKISFDKNQELIAKQLDLLTKEINEIKEEGFFKRIFSGKKEPIKGLYIYGDVGRGKSMLMDFFFDNIEFNSKRRVHFHSFMLEIHESIHKWRKERSDIEDDPIPFLADKIINESRLLCFDEFQVTDIADAMILGRLFKALFERRLIIVATSNRHPDDLYKDGLQRENFLPFIKMFKQKMNVSSLDSDTDYRMKHLKSLSTVYFTPLNKRADKFISESFQEMTANAEPQKHIIHIKGRELKVNKMHGDTAIFSFSELCEQPLGANDYIEIARRFSTILLSDIPQMSRENRNEAKRFVHLIDELYEHKVKLICTAATSPDKLYEKGDGAFEFERTISRLTEMQSEKYLKQEHLA